MINKEELIELTNKLYRLTLLFPKKEPLRYKMREAAIDILSDFSKLETQKTFAPEKNAKDIFLNIQSNLEVINSYFETAKWQNWISYFEVLNLQEKYYRIKLDLADEIKKAEMKGTEDFGLFGFEEKTPEIQPENPVKLEPREEKIVNLLKQVQKIQVGEITKLLPNISKRTIRRDFHKLVEEGVIERKGEKNKTFYRLKHQIS